MSVSLKKWAKSGEPWIWLNGGAVAIAVIMVLGLLALIAVRGLGHFWPHGVMEATHKMPGQIERRVVAEIVEEVQVSAAQIRATGVDIPEDVTIVDRYLLKIGNRELNGSDFRWVLADEITDIKYPEDILVMERTEWGHYYGRLVNVKEDGQIVANASDGAKAQEQLQKRIARVLELKSEIRDLEKGEIGKINYNIERLRLKDRRLELDGENTPENIAEVEKERQQYQAQYAKLQTRLNELYKKYKRDTITVVDMKDRQSEINLSHVVRAYQPNNMNTFEKIQFYFLKLGEFLGDDPREANTEGGVFPAIFGTVVMVLLMSVLVTPMGVIAAVYLREYAKQGFVTRMIRIAVNNLAGVPSIVYGVFGLGFFVYFVGGSIDEAFYPEALPAPTFGTSGLMWASLTLALLTLPVVIVATEEGLARIPRSVREGSLALGATKIETIWRVILPIASPAIMTGIILAIARAAGEVAPLMLVGVVKLAPSLPIDGNFPYLHLDYKFMHLGFHIYDVGFQSPNVEAARPLVYATALLLVLVIALLNLAAISIRNHLREKFKALEV